MVAGTVATGVGEGVSGSVLPVVAGTVATGVGAGVSGSVLPVVAGTVATGIGEGVSGSVLPVVAGTVATGVGAGVSGSVLHVEREQLLTLPSAVYVLIYTAGNSTSVLHVHCSHCDSKYNSTSPKVVERKC